MARSWLDAALIACVLVLGLLQGSRTALGRMPLVEADEPQFAVQGEPVAEADAASDALRGRFFRPEGSSATRPALRLRPSVWRPAGDRRLAIACSHPDC